MALQIQTNRDFHYALLSNDLNERKRSKRKKGVQIDPSRKEKQKQSHLSQQAENN
jgi:hypothetical protein